MKIDDAVEKANKLGYKEKICKWMQNKDNEVFFSAEVGKVFGISGDDASTYLLSLYQQGRVDRVLANKAKMIYGSKNAIAKLKKKMEEQK